MTSSGGSAAGGESAPLLDPACARLVHALQGPPRLHELGAQDGREALRELQDDLVSGPGVTVDFHTAPVGPHGLVGFLVVRPDDLDGPAPAVVHLHGGRWVTGDADTHGRLIRALAVGARSAIVVPEFTRVPEARYPVAVEEVYATLLWVVEHAADLDLDADRVAVSGDCTGATLAAVVAMLAGRRAGPRIAAQLLLYPWLEPRCDTASHHQFADISVLPTRAARWYWDQYADRPQDREDPAFAPARAGRSDLVGLPPTLVITAEADVVRDEGEAYARALGAAGVLVTCTRYLGVVHDFVTLRPLEGIPAARLAVRQAVAFLADALGT
ncbi:alpha/beta hydrolase [Actinomycetospora termitidis]|uniref:Alpha/beta hydrolase n=1 Tax=Actinomycetospora termitidis TaxID=3053470 RepID=A0ABT7M666_9PSEU|nr:alpha/beta hydrolase [Actinomycetospora sp. Odt1-22]MDL5156018.1 alpha/beta hydrolase [Actinomycetospora sp. Odt1-22]